MFIEINDISTGTLITEPLNALSIDTVFIREVDSKYRLIYKLNNGLAKIEEFDTEAAANERLDEIKDISIGGGGGGSYVLPIASATRLGGVKVGENLSIDANGVLSATGGSSVIDIDLGPIWDDLYTNKSVDLTSSDSTGVYTALQTLFVTDTSGKTVNLYTDITVAETGYNKFYTINIPINVIDFGSDDSNTPGVRYNATREIVGIFTYTPAQGAQAYLHYIHITAKLTSGSPNTIHIKLIREPNPIGSVPETGLTYKGNLPANNGNSGTNLSTIEPGIYYGGNISQFSVVNNPGASQRANLSDYGVYIRRGYLFIMFKSYTDAEVNTDFAVLYGVGVESQAIIEGIVRFTKRSTTLGIGIMQSSQSLTDVVMPSTAQTISGKKTFSTLPESSITPTTNNQLVNKKYVDDLVTAQIGTVSNQLSQI